MSREQGKRDQHYQLVMSIAHDMMEKGVISRDEYCEYETKMRAKYSPVFGDLFWRKA